MFVGAVIVQSLCNPAAGGAGGRGPYEVSGEESVRVVSELCFSPGHVVACHNEDDLAGVGVIFFPQYFHQNPANMCHHKWAWQILLTPVLLAHRAPMFINSISLILTIVFLSFSQLYFFQFSPIFLCSVGSAPGLQC